ncbi:hypothetical protein [Gordonia sp. (in: high G+C Gram-positive bacteria)]|uniref:hypothetical protein n=1 Tax=Gordonia sp. (in: high G+C Gram-positive bacteria) TaxID=84139 RepID=UPI0039E442DB
MLNRTTASIAGALAAGAILLGAAPAHAAQGGDDTANKRSWVKVGKSELDSAGGGSAVCAGTGVEAVHCLKIGKALDKERKKHPDAKGYWAEFHYKKGLGMGKTKSGTW